MKKKRFVALLLGALLTGTVIFNCFIPGEPAGTVYAAEQEQETKNYVKKTGVKEMSEDELAKKGRYQDDASRLADMQLMQTDGSLELWLDANFAEFAVVDTDSGEVWFSNPYDFESNATLGNEIKGLLQSLVTLTYYNKSGKEGTMNSYTNCTAKDQYTIEKLEKGFAFHMQIGHVEGDMFLPYVVTVDSFENKILPFVSEKNGRKLNSYYTKVAMSDNKLSDSVKKNYLKSYPGLNEQDFYILRGVGDREKKLISGIIQETEYTREDLESELELSGYENKDTDPALFNITLKVELENGELKVTVPASSISFDSSEFFLAKFQLLNYFGAGKSENDGYLFVPDGSGALIHYNKYGTKKILYTTNTVYGQDYALSLGESLNSLSTQIYMPVFGNMTGERGMLAVVENGEALANIISESGNILTDYETVYTEFHYNTSYTINYTDSSKIRGIYTYHDTNAYTGDYGIRYHFLTGEDANYVGMAKAYQNYLAERGVIQKLPEEEDEAQLYVETLGSIERTTTTLGVPHVESVVLTGFEQAQNILEELSQAEAGKLNLRYKGWMNNGLYYTVSNKVKVEKALGGKKGLQQLAAYTDSKDVGFYPDVDFFMVKEQSTFDGYSPSRNSSHSIKREQLYLLSPQELTNLPYLQYINYSVSPYYYEGYMKQFFKDYDKLGMKGISEATMGNMLYSEFHKKKTVNREQAKDILVRSMENYTKEYQLMVDGGNAYTLPYAEKIVNVPVHNSAYTTEDESIPFMQLVLHGYKHYSGEAVNLSGSYQEQLLRGIEYGTAPLFTVAAGNDDILKETSLCYYYAVNWDNLKDNILNYAKEWHEAYDGLENLSMINHGSVDKEVYRTEYEDGTVFYVNYGVEDYSLEDGTVVPARDYRKICK